jgi:hypothetical protein
MSCETLSVVAWQILADVSKIPNAIIIRVIRTSLSISKYNQQDATLHNLFISVKCSTCLRRYFRPSSGDQKLYIRHRVLVKCQWEVGGGGPAPLLPIGPFPPSNLTPFRI